MISLISLSILTEIFYTITLTISVSYWIEKSQFIKRNNLADHRHTWYNTSFLVIHGWYYKSFDDRRHRVIYQDNFILYSWTFLGLFSHRKKAGYFWSRKNIIWRQALEKSPKRNKLENTRQHRYCNNCIFYYEWF